MAILVAPRLGRATMAIVILGSDGHAAMNITPWSASVTPRWPSRSVSPSPSAGVSGNTLQAAINVNDDSVDFGAAIRESERGGQRARHGGVNQRAAVYGVTTRVPPNQVVAS